MMLVVWTTEARHFKRACTF